MREFAIWQDQDWLRRQLFAGAIAAGFAAALALLGAYASDRYDPFQRVGYWMSIFFAWAVVSRLTLWLLSRRRAPAAPDRWKTLLVATVIASVPMMGVVTLATAAISDWTPNVEDFVEQILGVWLLGGAYLFLVDRAFRSESVPAPFTAAPPEASVEEPAVPVADAAPSRPSRLLERQVGRGLEEIIGLSGEDHYVRVHTRTGSWLVLMRFNEALDEVAGLDGSRVHRSWWVANRAVTGLTREGRTARLDLETGVTVPVSQPYMTEATGRWGEG